MNDATFLICGVYHQVEVYILWLVALMLIQDTKKFSFSSSSSFSSLLCLISKKADALSFALPLFHIMRPKTHINSQSNRVSPFIAPLLFLSSPILSLFATKKKRPQLQKLLTFSLYRAWSLHLSLEQHPPKAIEATCNGFSSPPFLSLPSSPDHFSSIYESRGKKSEYFVFSPSLSHPTSIRIRN